MFKLRKHTKSCLHKDPIKTQKMRLENALHNGCGGQIFVWPVKKYLEYKKEQQIKKEEENISKETVKKVKKKGVKRKKKDDTSSSSDDDDEDFGVKKPKKTKVKSQARPRKSNVSDEDHPSDILQQLLTTPPVKEEGKYDDVKTEECDPNELLKVKYEAESEHSDAEDIKVEVDSDVDENGDLPSSPYQNDDENYIDYEGNHFMSSGNRTEDNKESILLNILKKDYSKNINKSEDHVNNGEGNVKIRIKDTNNGDSSNIWGGKVNRNNGDTVGGISEDDEDYKPKKKQKRKRMFPPATKNENGMYVCDICQKEFSMRCSMNRHKREYHMKEGRYGPVKCPHCGMESVNKRSLAEHIKSMHDNIKYNCEVCQASLTSEYSLLRHKREVHGDTTTTISTGKQFDCQFCGKQLSTKAKLTKHVERFHEDGLTHDAPIGRMIGRVLWKDKEKTASNKAVICPQCGHKSASPRHLKQHIKNMHSETDKLEEGSEPVCKECGKVFPDARLLRIHVKHTHERHLHVQICPYCAKEHIDLKKHIREYHPDGNNDIFCKECDILVPHMDWRMHKEKFHGQGGKREICPHCGIMATKEHIEYKHMRDPVPCDICGVTLKNKRALRNHKSKVHAPTEIVTCSYCNQVFDNKVKLYQHQYKNHHHRAKAATAI